MFEIELIHYLILASIVFSIGVFGILMNRKNLIMVLMSIELLLLATNINLVAFSAYLKDVTGQLFAIFVLTVAAAEVSIGLAIIVVYFRNNTNLEIEKLKKMKG
ncbi:MAG: NADH-quinone oxidoreductase subunit NuoK [Rickettsiales bacterium]